MSTCRSCGAEVLWAKTRAGKAMPVDPEPTAEGNVLVGGKERAGHRQAVVDRGDWRGVLRQAQASGAGSDRSPFHPAGPQ